MSRDSRLMPALFQVGTATGASGTWLPANYMADPFAHHGCLQAMPAAIGEGGSDEAVHGLQVVVAELMQLQEAANEAQEELPAPLLDQVRHSGPVGLTAG
jgi:hypothetical protein